jgi:hypothetical protein
VIREIPVDDFENFASRPIALDSSPSPRKPAFRQSGIDNTLDRKQSFALAEARFYFVEDQPI